MSTNPSGDPRDELNGERDWIRLDLAPFLGFLLVIVAIVIAVRACGPQSPQAAPATATPGAVITATLPGTATLTVETGAASLATGTATSGDVATTAPADDTTMTTTVTADETAIATALSQTPLITTTAPAPDTETAGETPGLIEAGTATASAEFAATPTAVITATTTPPAVQTAPARPPSIETASATDAALGTESAAATPTVSETGVATTAPRPSEGIAVDAATAATTTAVPAATITDETGAAITATIPAAGTESVAPAPTATGATQAALPVGSATAEADATAATTSTSTQSPTTATGAATATSTATTVSPQVDRLPDLQAPGPVTLSGQAGPGAVVEVVINGERVGFTIAGLDGGWALVVRIPTPGAYQIEARVIDASGAVLAAGETAELRVPSPTTPTPAATPTEPPTPAPTSTPAPTATATPTATAAADAATAKATSTATTVSPQVDRLPDLQAPGPVTLTGQASPGAVVEVVINGERVGFTIAGLDGGWALVVRIPTPGAYQIEARVIDASGAVLAAGETAELRVPSPTTPTPATTPTEPPTPAPTSTPAPTATTTPTATTATELHGLLRRRRQCRPKSIVCPTFRRPVRSP